MEYALYEGDNFVMIGTMKEMAKATNLAECTLRYYGSPSHLKRCQARKNDNYKIVIKIEE